MDYQKQGLLRLSGIAFHSGDQLKLERASEMEIECIEIIGEAAYQVTPETRHQTRSIPWEDMWRCSTDDNDYVNKKAQVILKRMPSR